MKGYRTIVVNIIALLASVAMGFGFEIDPVVQAEIATGILAMINIGLRFITSSPVGKSE